MSSLTKSIYLAFSKSRFSKEIAVHAEFNKAKRLLVRLAENPPYTLFSIFTAIALKKCKRDRRMTVIVPKDASMLLFPYTGTFDEKIEIDSTPAYGSKSFKLIKEKLQKPEFDVMLDFDPIPLPEIAVLSSAKIRVACAEKDCFPYFNILFRSKKETDLTERASLVLRSLTGEESMQPNPPRLHTQQLKASAWLKDKGNGRKNPYILSSINIPNLSSEKAMVFPPEAWQNESDDTKAALFASASAYIGGIDRNFELAYLFEIPSVVFSSDDSLKSLIPESSFMKLLPLQHNQQPSNEIIIKALENIII
ncbi:hypothetical protein GX441_05305 [bacterium]|nr:hypothetical protein [bacterium]